MRLAANATLTRAHVVIDGGTTDWLEVPCVTLDGLLARAIKPGDGSLPKLDLQGYELNATLRASETLQCCDVILSEVSFYAQAYEPPISELTAFLTDRGFELYDIASLYARPRDYRPRQGDLIFVLSDSSLVAYKSWC